MPTLNLALDIRKLKRAVTEPQLCSNSKMQKTLHAQDTAKPGGPPQIGAISRDRLG